MSTLVAGYTFPGLLFVQPRDHGRGEPSGPCALLAVVAGPRKGHQMDRMHSMRKYQQCGAWPFGMRPARCGACRTRFPLDVGNARQVDPNRRTNRPRCTTGPGNATRPPSASRQVTFTCGRGRHSSGRGDPVRLRLAPCQTRTPSCATPGAACFSRALREGQPGQ